MVKSELNEKQVAYIGAREHFDNVFFQYTKLVSEYRDVWQNDMRGFVKFLKKARKITGLEQAQAKLEQIERELTNRDDIQWLNTLVGERKV
ncbi:hypothetical protein LPY66_15570 [Dehalobacter sp. DCM]|uniref:hypothetical protein n=1 Tax=Dehalobacter sp. DCM TaxID=2907827 RepID=UPI003081633A|nr:hypothetical protein LPY66_15570 [Dehalobacter sp. DCM]